jgi:hypothetical protein
MIRRAFAAALLLPLAACVIPYPSLPRDTWFRANLDAAPAITPGTTTAADLVLALGEPDGSDPAGGWMAWTAARNRGGLGLLIAIGNAATTTSRDSVDYRRLRVRFGADGRVADATDETRNCNEWHGDRRPEAEQWSPCPGWAWVRGEQP